MLFIWNPRTITSNLRVLVYNPWMVPGVGIVLDSDLDNKDPINTGQTPCSIVYFVEKFRDAIKKHMYTNAR